MRRRPATLATTLAAAAAVTALAGSGQAAPPPPTSFGPAVQVTPPHGGGYEPGVISDRYGNLIATAHKENAELVVAPDSRNPALVRSQSWAWYSADHGSTWKNLPEGPGDVYSHTFGDEGDLATDDAGGVYMVDTNVTDINFTAWHATGLDKFAFTRHLPTVGAGQPVDDRPWVTAHQDGHVFYFGNEGDKDSYPAAHMGEAYGSGTGPGRYTVYSSYDGGATWDHVGIQLADSGWCRPAAAPHSSYVYALCTNDSGADGNVHNQGDPGYTTGKLWGYVSADDGKTWKRYDTGARYNSSVGGGYYSWPSLTVAKDGSLWGLYLNSLTPGCTSSCTPKGSQFLVMHSTDHGRHWKVIDATPQRAGIYEYAWLAVSPDGKRLGLATYRHDGPNSPWYVEAGMFSPGQHPRLTSVDPSKPASYLSGSAPGDFLTCTFDPAGHLSVMWTRLVTSADTPAASAYVYRDIFTARSK